MYIEKRWNVTRDNVTVSLEWKYIFLIDEVGDSRIGRLYGLHEIGIVIDPEWTGPYPEVALFVIGWRLALWYNAILSWMLNPVPFTLQFITARMLQSIHEDDD